MFEFIQAVLTADMADTASIEYKFMCNINQLDSPKTSQNHDVP